MVFNCRSLFNEAAYLAALRRLRSPFAVRDADSKQSKTKIYEKKSPLVADFGCNRQIWISFNGFDDICGPK